MSLHTLTLVGLTLCLGVSVAICVRGEPRSARRVGLLDVVEVGLLALALRAAFMLVQEGAAYDIASYQIVGEQLRHGLDVFVQPALARQNYPPVVVWWSALCATVASSSTYGFAMMEKSLFCLADAGVAVSLLWIAPAGFGRRAALLYALSPIAIAVCALHGQFDSLVLLPLLWALHLLERTPGRAGLQLGAALAIKTWPVFFLPLMVFRLGLRRGAAFVGLAVAIPALAFASYATIHPDHLLAGIVQTVAYTGNPSSLGIAVFGLMPKGITVALNVDILVAIAAVGWILRRAPIQDLFAASACLLLGLSPTISTQYLGWPVPSMIAASRLRLTTVYAAVVLPGLAVLTLWVETGQTLSGSTVLFALAGVGPLAIGVSLITDLYRKREPGTTADLERETASPGVARGKFRPASVSVVLPAYNEEAVIATTVRRSCAAVREAGFSAFEVIVVNDGSSDGTEEVCGLVASELGAVRVVSHASNQGYGAALRSGFESAGGEAILLMDSDGQFDPRDLRLLLQHWDGATVVCGYRTRRADPMIRRLNHFAFFTLVNALFGATARDVNCGFKLFPREVGQGLTSDGALVSTELLLRARERHLRVVDVGVSHYPRLTGMPTGARIQVIARAAAELWRLRARLRRSRRVPAQVRLQVPGGPQIGL
jgi:hypothetical protein